MFNRDLTCFQVYNIFIVDKLCNLNNIKYVNLFMFKRVIKIDIILNKNN